MTLSFLVYFQSLSTFHSLPKIPDIHLKLFILLYHSVVLFRHHFFKTDVLLHLRLISCHIHLCVISYGILSSIHKRPHPTLSFGYRSNPGRGWAPRRRYAFTFSPQRKGSFPLTIPHSIINAAAPVTNGVAKDVPVTPV